MLGARGAPVKSAATIFAAALAVACLAEATPASAAAGRIERGRAIAKENCARCHAIGRSGESPNPKSPPFRRLGKNIRSAISKKRWPKASSLDIGAAKCPVSN
jgi:mono/diheme cytochrome c family protein